MYVFMYVCTYMYRMYVNFASERVQVYKFCYTFEREYVCMYVCMSTNKTLVYVCMYVV